MPIDYTSPEGIMSADVLSSVGKYGKNKAVQIMVNGKWARADRGILIGCYPSWGYKLIRKHWEGNILKEAYFEKDLAEDWKIKNGTYYDINPDINFMRIQQRSLHLANQYGVPLEEEEYLAILLSEGQNDDTNASYKYREPDLATILHYANDWCQRIEKQTKVAWP